MAGRRHNLQHTPPQWDILDNLLTLQIDTVATAYHWYQPWLVDEQTIKWPQLPFPWVLEGYHINWSSTHQSTLFTLIGIVVEGYHINWSSIDQSTLLFTLIGIFIWPLQNISCFKKKKSTKKKQDHCIQITSELLVEKNWKSMLKVKPFKFAHCTQRNPRQTPSKRN